MAGIDGGLADHAAREIRSMNRIFVIAALLSTSPTAAFAAGPIVMHRDPGCGCCEKWAALAGRALQRSVKIIDNGDRAAFRRAKGVPDAAQSCHTAIVDGLIVEGHVPLVDIRAALAQRPRSIVALAVPGMPLGSPGMEVPGGRVDRFEVLAFGQGGPRVFARHGT